MVKRKCGTCKYFRDNGIAGSGTCTHPARADIASMVLVRRTELACRNAWDQDLWEMAEQPDEIHTSADIPVPVQQNPSQLPVQANITDERYSQIDPAQAGEMFTDRIQSISMPTRSQLRPTGPVPVARDDADDDSNDQDTGRMDVREARRRRQEQRALQARKLQQNALQEISELMDGSKPADPADAPLARVRGFDGPMTTRNTEPVRINPDVPAVADQPAAGAKPPLRALEFRRQPPTFSGAEPSNTERGGERKRDRKQDTEPLPTPEEMAAYQAQQAAECAPADAASREPESPRRRHSDVVAPREQRPAIQLRPIDRDGRTTPPSTQVRQVCATCRHFLSTGDGRAGWCTNEYAFPERTMVESDALSCRSTLGSWWLPNDDVWLSQADISHHGRPTPLLDEESGAQRRAGQRDQHQSHEDLAER